MGGFIAKNWFKIGIIILILAILFNLYLRSTDYYIIKQIPNLEYIKEKLEFLK